MSNFNAVIAQLKQVREKAVREVNRLDAALSALGSLNGMRTGRGAKGCCNRRPQNTHDVSIGTSKDRVGATAAMGKVAEGSKSRVDFGVELHFANARR